MNEHKEEEVMSKKLETTSSCLLVIDDNDPSMSFTQYKLNEKKKYVFLCRFTHH